MTSRTRKWLIRIAFAASLILVGGLVFAAYKFISALIIVLSVD